MRNQIDNVSVFAGTAESALLASVVSVSNTDSFIKGLFTFAAQCRVATDIVAQEKAFAEVTNLTAAAQYCTTNPGLDTQWANDVLDLPNMSMTGYMESFVDAVVGGMTGVGQRATCQRV